MTEAPRKLVINGWTIFAHPVFISQFESLVCEVAKLREKYPADYVRKNSAKRLAAISKLVLDVIPRDPEHPDFRQGDTLGDDRKHWFRARFFQQYRLFFRFHRSSKIIVFGWVNDDTTKRAYGSGSDAYKVFSKMLDKGRPPDDWARLLAEATEESSHWIRLSDTTST